jgi:hypothetical protein
MFVAPSRHDLPTPQSPIQLRIEVVSFGAADFVAITVCNMKNP